jgi:ribosomal-protein-alanine N-acetyltransferase
VEISGPTLTLRFATPEDAPALFALASDPQVTRFFSWGPYTSIEQPLAYIDRLAGQRERGEQLDVLIVHRDAGPIGVTGLVEFSHRDRRAIVGSWLGRDWWGSGANTEAKALIARLAFEHLGLDRVGAYADVVNARSQAALEKVGFVREGVLRSWHRHGDSVHDVWMFGLLRDDFARSPLAAIPGELRGDLPPAFVVVQPPNGVGPAGGAAGAAGAGGTAASPSSADSGG